MVLNQIFRRSQQIGKGSSDNGLLFATFENKLFANVATLKAFENFNTEGVYQIFLLLPQIRRNIWIVARHLKSVSISQMSLSSLNFAFVLGHEQ